MNAIFLLLLLFLATVYSQKDDIYCSAFDECPKGYTKIYSGRNMLKAVCLCKKILTPAEICEDKLIHCKERGGDFCSSINMLCPAELVIDLCDKVILDIPSVCDPANAKLRAKRKIIDYNDTTACDTAKIRCNNGSMPCYRLSRYCDANTVLEYCKNGKIDYPDLCINMERETEVQRVESRKYTCSYSVRNCLEGDQYIGHCSRIPSSCDSKTTAKFCYKNLIEDEETCASAIKKSQRLMDEEIDEPNCSQKIKQCERNDLEACIEVPTICGKDAVSALCNAKKITNTRMCTYAGLENVANSSYPGCDSFEEKCSEPNSLYCDLASRYCDSKTIVTLCDHGLITTTFACRNARKAIY